MIPTADMYAEPVKIHYIVVNTPTDAHNYDRAIAKLQKDEAMIEVTCALNQWYYGAE